MVRQVRTPFVVLLLLLLALGPLAGVSNAQTNDTGKTRPSADIAAKRGVTPTSVETKVGEITTIDPSSVPDEQSNGIKPQYAEQCHRQLIIMEYKDNSGKPFIKFTGVKKWCFNGQKVTRGTMDVVPWIRADFKYGPGQDGYRYVPSALKKTDRFFTYKGHFHGALESTRLGRFEYRVHGLGKVAQVLNPYVSRIAHYDGACDGPNPKDASPRVTALKPAAGARGIPAMANVEATFSRKMNPRTLKSTNFYLVNKRTGDEVRATYRYDAAKKKAILDPVRRLSPGVTYTARVFSGPYGALTADGDPITSNKTWSFVVAR